MKKLSLLLCFLVLTIFTSTSLFAQLTDENFEYPVGDPITLHGWTSNGNPGANSILIVSPGLDFPCYAGSGLGFAVALNSSGPDAFKFLSRKVDSGSAYVSIMVKITSAQSTGDYFFHLSDSSSGFNSDIGRIYARDSAGRVAFGLNKEGNNNEIYTPAQYYIDSTYVLLIKYTFVPGADNDLVSLLVFTNCPPLLEPLPTLGPMGLGSNDLPEVGKVTLRQGATSHAPTLIIDGIYTETSWGGGPLPVELTAFYSNVIDRDVVLNWATSSEINNSGFNIERSIVNGEWSMVGNVSGNGTSTSTHSYTFTDRGLSSGIYNYRLKQIDYNGNFEYFNLSNEIQIGTPNEFNLSQNYPNPFNPSTKISFDLASDGFVSVKIYDYLGREVSSLVNEFRTAGYYSVDFNAANMSSGVYFYKLQSNGFSKVMKMSLVK